MKVFEVPQEDREFNETHTLTHYIPNTYYYVLKSKINGLYYLTDSVDPSDIDKMLWNLRLGGWNSVEELLGGELLEYLAVNRCSTEMDEFIDKIDTLCYRYGYEIWPTDKINFTNPDGSYPTFTVHNKNTGEKERLIYIDGDGRGE